MATSFLTDIPPFDPDVDPYTTPQRWKDYLRKIERALQAWDIKDDGRRHSVLLHCGGDKLDKIEQHLTYDKTEKDALFKNCCEAFTTYFELKRNITFST